MDLSGRRKRLQETARRAFPQTPTKKEKVTPLEKDESCLDQEECSTVRKRRGYRPLSVLTKSVLFPFDAETLNAMDALRYKEMDTVKFKNKSIAGEKGHEDEEPSISTDDNNTVVYSPTYCNENTPSALRLYHDQVRFPDSGSLVTITPRNKSEISLREFLKTSSPKAPVLKSDFASLIHLPPPDPSQHPLFSLTPFKSESDSPCLMTQTTSQEIRHLSIDSRSSRTSASGNRTSGSSDGSRSIERKRMFNFDILRSPERSKTKSFKSPMESPLSRRYRSIEIPAILEKTSSSDESNRKRSSSDRIRKLSDMFRSRPSTSNLIADDEIPSLENRGIVSPNLHRADLEEYLRRTSYSPSYPFHPSSWFPRHPTTARSWKSRNLKCTTCLEVCCACCGRACCAYKAAVMALDNHKNNSQNRDDAIERMQQITMVYPYGQEAPTFLQCTAAAGGNSRGCGKMVCPDCCGLCPDEACSDLQCRKCKRDPWRECEWHTATSIDTGAIFMGGMRSSPV